MKLKLIFMALLFGCTGFSSQEEENNVVMNRMAVRWEVQDDKISFELSAPEHGWLAIGFNTGEHLSGTHLIMACVKDNKVEAKDYYIQSPGKYKAITELGGKGIVYNTEGYEGFSGTQVKFTLPLDHRAEYYLPLQEGKEYKLLMAYSMEDDFDHHSIMRTSTTIKL